MMMPRNISRAIACTLFYILFSLTSFSLFSLSLSPLSSLLLCRPTYLDNDTRFTCKYTDSMMMPRNISRAIACTLFYILFSLTSFSLFSLSLSPLSSLLLCRPTYLCPSHQADGVGFHLVLAATGRWQTQEKE
eukprot:TRINITY_DN4066_c0_g1_i2.p2 TRINITY_DN4066_c0_g1~~TRINITY_DN4066_c0_g1_i2.p2  ORF type:complete len:154 (-),score=18.60 TRINITY_DN4066_c0_g1_i2:533-931(-)